MKAAVRDVKPAVEYPPFVLCQSLRLVAQMIAAEVPTRVFYVTLGGFDTHSAQLNRHAGLLQELSQALSLFRKDLKAQGHLDRVLVLTFSEFGRRAAENKQLGTDHGTANVMFLMGGKVKPGLAWRSARPHPSWTSRATRSTGRLPLGLCRRPARLVECRPGRVLGAQFEPLYLMKS